MRVDQSLPSPAAPGSVAGPWLSLVLLLLAGCTAPTVGANQAPAPVAPVAEAPPRPPAVVAEAPPDLPGLALLDQLPEPEAPRLRAPDGAGPARIGLLLPLSGPEEMLGRSLLDAAQMALFDVGGDRVVLLPRDTRGSAEGARLAAESALQEGAELLLGPVFSASVAAAAGPARERGVNLVAFSTDATVAGDGVFLLSFLHQQQVDRVVGYAASQGLRAFAALTPETPYGIAVVDSLRVAADRYGGALTDVEFYPPGAVDVMEPARRLADYDARRDRLAARRRTLEAQGDQAGLAQLAGLETLGGPGFDALMLPEGGDALRQVAPLLPFFDIDPENVRFLGTGLWDDPALGQEPALVGGWFAAPPPENAARFVERFSATYEYRPARIATLAYDAVALAVALSRREQPDFSRAAIAGPSGFAGTDGIFRFLSSGIVERGLAVVEVEARGLKVVDPAPQTFQRMVN